jgi:hypothetical protein
LVGFLFPELVIHHPHSTRLLASHISMSVWR